MDAATTNMDTDEATIIIVDGSQGEGGGQILRNSISLAAILKKDIRIHSIRAGRSKPGLRAQHMTSLQLCADMSGGTLEGCSLESAQIEYRPAKKSSNEPQNEDLADDDEATFVGDAKTAGSVCLMLQASLPCALFSSTPSKIILRGGTNASMAPQWDYWEHVFLPFMERAFGDEAVTAEVSTRGYFPQGKGEVIVDVEPLEEPLKAINQTERGEVTSIRIRSFVAGKLPPHIAKDMAKSASKVLRESYPHIEPAMEMVQESSAVGNGSGILIVAETSTGCLLAGSALGDRKKRSKETGQEAAIELLETLKDGGCVDEWLQDQILIYMALAKGTSRVLTGSLTLHTQTAMWIAETLTGVKFTVTKMCDGGRNTRPISTAVYGKKDRIAGQHMIECEGMGLSR